MELVADNHRVGSLLLLVSIERVHVVVSLLLYTGEAALRRGTQCGWQADQASWLCGWHGNGLSGDGGKVKETAVQTAVYDGQWQSPMHITTMKQRLLLQCSSTCRLTRSFVSGAIALFNSSQHGWGKLSTGLVALFSVFLLTYADHISPYYFKSLYLQLLHSHFELLNYLSTALTITICTGPCSSKSLVYYAYV